MAYKEVDRIRRMWAEVSEEPLPELMATKMAQRLTAEDLPNMRAEHKVAVLARALDAAAERRGYTAAAVGHDRTFRRRLDRGSTGVGTSRLLDAVRPHLALLSWSYWVLAGVLFALSVFVFPKLAGWGPGALIVTVPLLALVSLLYTVRAGSSGMREWERSCPVTPFQIALARTTLVLGITVACAFIATLALVRQDVGLSLAALTVSWFAPLLLIVGLYMAFDLLFGGWTGPVGAAVAWFVHLAVTEGGRAVSTVAYGVIGAEVSTYDVVTLLAGAFLLLISLLLTWKGSEETHADRAA